MNFYNILRLWAGRIPRPLKFLGLWYMHVSGRRMIGVYLDPVLGCNLRCRMCYFSDSEKRRQLHGSMTGEQLGHCADALFHRALKLQIGCGAEPTLYKRLDEVIRRGKESGIPYVSLTTNGMLIVSGKTALDTLVKSGLDELTLSMHGTSRSIYEELMPGADYDSLLKLLNIIAEIKQTYPSFKVRVNFTVNSLNKDDLRDNRFLGIWQDGCLPDIVQIRPVQNIGDSEWRDFVLTTIVEDYDATVGNVVERCRQAGITCIAPTRDNLLEVATPQDGYDSLLESVCYCYVSPTHCYKNDFDSVSDSYESYHRRRHTAAVLLGAVFRNPGSKKRNVSKKLNYKIK